MTRRREPVAELGDEDYRIVRHTHDVELARRLMAERLTAELRAEFGRHFDETEDAFSPADVGTPQQVHMRIVPCLPGSYGDGEGWRFEYRHCGPGRGAFPAVVFSS